MLEISLRRKLISTALAMNELGLNQGMSGNISVRRADRVFITPSALAYAQCRPADIVTLDFSGQAEGRRKPSSEWRLHLDIYKNRPEAGAVLHAHPSWCTTLACLELEIPAIHYMVAVAGGDSIRCAEYALYGTRELSEHVKTAMEDRRACLMSHHGMVCFAESPEQALELAVEVENLARVYAQTLQTGSPQPLGPADMVAVRQKFADYRGDS